VTMMRIPVLIFEGILTVGKLYNSLYVFPFFILALFLGNKVYLKLNEVLFKKIMLALLFISGIMLMVK
ncbi:MAG TPA: sulfite exporter TauE/SafE family protein, partial [Flavobacterium sp.]